MERYHRGMRRITVAGTTYRWRIRRQPTYSQALTWRGMTVLVMAEARGGQRLIVALPWPHPGNWLGAPAQAVTPAMVAALIAQALVAGWTPDRPGSPFALTVGAVAAARLLPEGAHG